MPTPRVSIIGASGAFGFGLALRLGYEGIPIVVGSRDIDRARETVDRLLAMVPSGGFRAASNGEAAADAEIIFLCVPFRNQSEILTNIKQHLSAGQIIVDSTVPLAAAISGKATRMLGVWQGSAAEQAEEMVPDGVKVVSGMHTVSASVLGNLGTEIEQDALLCSDYPEAKQRVAAVLSKIEHLRCVDCGMLEQARNLEPLAALAISINKRYRVHTGIHLTDLPAKLWD